MNDLIHHIYTELLNHIDQINELNVFPIPDKDTGTNIANTIKSLSGSTLKEISNGVLLSARGSSGNILAAFLIGAANSTSKNYHEICESGYKNIIQSLTGIKDGTLASSLHHTPQDYSNLKDFLLKYQDILINDLLDSPNKNETLKKYNTVDSGILALIYIVNSILNYRYEVDKVSVETSILMFQDRIKIRYCNEYLIKGRLNGFKKNLLSALGNEILIISHSGNTKVHIHSNYPKVIYYLLKKKTLNYKIEDMHDFNRKLNIKELGRK